MAKSVPDAPPVDGRSTHWNYGCAAHLKYRWEEWVAMSELMVGPEYVRRNDDGHVTSINLRGRNISQDRLVNLQSFPLLEHVDLRDSSATNQIVPVLLSLENLRSVDLLGSSVNLWGLVRLGMSRKHVDIDGPTDRAVGILFGLIVAYVTIALLFILYSELS